MSDFLKGGTGKGFLAGVNAFNRLDSSCATSPRIYYESRDRKNAFGVSTPYLTVTTGGEKVLYMKNTSSTQNMVLTDLRVNWNGGSTTWIKSLKGSIWFASEAPTANNTTGAAGNLNRSSTKPFDIDVEYWDGVAGGMTSAGGAAALNTIVGQGSLLFPIGGAIILGANDTILFQLTGEETGEASIQILGFMEAI